MEKARATPLNDCSTVRFTRRFAGTQGHLSRHHLSGSDGYGPLGAEQAPQNVMFLCACRSVNIHLDGLLPWHLSPRSLARSRPRRLPLAAVISTARLAAPSPESGSTRPPRTAVQTTTVRSAVVYRCREPIFDPETGPTRFQRTFEIVLSTTSRGLHIVYRFVYFETICCVFVEAVNLLV